MKVLVTKIDAQVQQCDLRIWISAMYVSNPGRSTILYPEYEDMSVSVKMLTLLFLVPSKSTADDLNWVEISDTSKLDPDPCVGKIIKSEQLLLLNS